MKKSIYALGSLTEEEALVQEDVLRQAGWLTLVAVRSRNPENKLISGIKRQPWKLSEQPRSDILEITQAYGLADANGKRDISRQWRLLMELNRE